MRKMEASLEETYASQELTQVSQPKVWQWMLNKDMSNNPFIFENEKNNIIILE